MAPVGAGAAAGAATPTGSATGGAGGKRSRGQADCEAQAVTDGGRVGGATKKKGGRKARMGRNHYEDAKHA